MKKTLLLGTSFWLLLTCGSSTPATVIERDENYQIQCSAALAAATRLRRPDEMIVPLPHSWAAGLLEDALKLTVADKKGEKASAETLTIFAEQLFPDLTHRNYKDYRLDQKYFLRADHTAMMVEWLSSHSVSLFLQDHKNLAEQIAPSILGADKKFRPKEKSFLDWGRVETKNLPSVRDYYFAGVFNPQQKILSADLKKFVIQNGEDKNYSVRVVLVLWKKSLVEARLLALTTIIRTPEP